MPEPAKNQSNVSCDSDLLVIRPAGRPLSSDWSVNNSTMVVKEKFLKVQSQHSVQSTNKKNSHRQPL